MPPQPNPPTHDQTPGDAPGDEKAREIDDTESHLEHASAGDAIHAPGSIWDGAVVISTYTRAQAIEDGVLVDLSPDTVGIDEAIVALCRQHYRWPIAVTRRVWSLVEKSVAHPEWHNDLAGVLHDILWMSRRYGRNISPTERLFSVIITGAGRRRNWTLKIVSGPDDAGEPCLTIMFPDED